MERWSVDEISGVPVSTWGRVRTKIKGIHFGSDNGNGVKFVWGNGERHSVRQMVGRTFIPNPEPGYYTLIGHVDPKGTDNRVENLQWTTRSLALLNSKSYNVSKKPNGTWRAKVNIKGSSYNLGTYKKKPAAKRASAGFKWAAAKIMTFNDDGRVNRGRI
jgi:hypothetical protein